MIRWSPRERLDGRGPQGGQNGLPTMPGRVNTVEKHSLKFSFIETRENDVYEQKYRDLDIWCCGGQVISSGTDFKLDPRSNRRRNQGSPQKPFLQQNEAAPPLPSASQTTEPVVSKFARFGGLPELAAASLAVIDVPPEFGLVEVDPDAPNTEEAEGVPGGAVLDTPCRGLWGVDAAPEGPAVSPFALSSRSWKNEVARGFSRGGDLLPPPGQTCGVFETVETIAESTTYSGNATGQKKHVFDLGQMFAGGRCGQPQNTTAMESCSCLRSTVISPKTRALGSDEIRVIPEAQLSQPLEETFNHTHAHPPQHSINGNMKYMSSELFPYFASCNREKATPKHRRRFLKKAGYVHTQESTPTQTSTPTTTLIPVRRSSAGHPHLGATPPWRRTYTPWSLTP